MRKIDFNKEKHFKCDGKEWEVIQDELSILRHRVLQSIALEFGYSTSFEDIFNNLKLAVECYNKHDYFQMSIILYKMQEGIKNIEQKDDPALRICTLFINEKGEDPTKYNDAMAQSKIDSWGKEIDITSFFYLATSLCPGWLPAYKILIQNGSQKEQEKESESQKQ